MRLMRSRYRCFVAFYGSCLNVNRGRRAGSSTGARHFRLLWGALKNILSLRCGSSLLGNSMFSSQKTVRQQTWRAAKLWRLIGYMLHKRIFRVSGPCCRYLSLFRSSFLWLQAKQCPKMHRTGRARVVPGMDWFILENKSL
ncbi:unnamed protein product [Chondrus crispus]|uniref:Uncharacterized protein n=1 Tax=Chondrus crispus TaxID=2769 RepID=R7Q7G0_CHOCR|nr:unnamed protein product [Chondrus crispus]CDF33768.1 unnamed protein product [Chondrus crispus]|eukprot:XP_005713587.1 unnamed protein product [Chondrus crispus]